MNTLLRNEKPKEFSKFDEKDTLMWIEMNTVMSTMKKNLVEVVLMVCAFSEMSWKIIQIRLNNVSDFMKSIGHCSLESGTGIL